LSLFFFFFALLGWAAFFFFFFVLYDFLDGFQTSARRKARSPLMMWRACAPLSARDMMDDIGPSAAQARRVFKPKGSAWL
jgi:hypothetical protein